MSEQEINLNEAVLRARLHEEVDKSVSFQIELNKLAQQYNLLQEENEKLKKDNAELEEKLEEASENETDRTDKKKNTKA